ncbi:hypothetical protein CEXT_651921 [Caerostris extrusa]|uniref:Uncharacterized protein n=1 Tax=Caerostris extrusa TaxID=172846 RepID=A0AAV4WV38_CAEEX|nr:hypothetical protein CEXT_651921 [Caerostris extrusa]
MNEIYKYLARVSTLTLSSYTRVSTLTLSSYTRVSTLTLSSYTRVSALILSSYTRVSALILSYTRVSALILSSYTRVSTIILSSYTHVRCAGRGRFVLMIISDCSAVGFGHSDAFGKHEDLSQTDRGQRRSITESILFSVSLARRLFTVSLVDKQRC